MRWRALMIAGSVLLLIAVWAGVSISRARTIARETSFQPQPSVLIAGKGFGTADLAFLETGNAPWPFATPGFSERSISFPNAIDLRNYATLTIPLRLSGSTIGRVRTKLRLVHHNGWVYETWKELPLYFGDHGNLVVDVSADSCDMVPVGHGRPWDGESARAIRQLTLSVHSEGIAHGWLDVGAPKLDELPSSSGQRNESAFASGVNAPWPPADMKLLDFACGAGFQPANVPGRLEACTTIDVQFRFDPAPPDPFDPEHCEVRVLLVRTADEANLSGKLNRGTALPPEVLAQARPAFLDQDYFRYEGALNPAEELKPLGLPCFRARIPLDNDPQPGEKTIAVLILNGHVLSRAPLDLRTAGVPPANLAGETPAVRLDPVPTWTSSGGESFCEIYRPHSEWTGMPWRLEAARYTPVVRASVPAQPASPKKADWSYGAWSDKTACWVAPIEWNQAWGKWQGLGRYDLELCWRFDRILETAGDKDVRLPLLLSADTMFFNQGKYRWPMNPLCSESGGPIAGSGQFFTDSQARENFRRRLRYVAARYGTSPALSGWLFGATIPADRVPEWHKEMAALLASLDQARGWYRPPNTHLSEGVPDLRTAGVPPANGAGETPAVRSHAIVSLHPWATDFEKTSRKNSFEPGSPDFDAWNAEQRLSPGTHKRLATEQASDGRQSVALRSNSFPGHVCLVRELLFKTAESDNFYDYHTMIFDVYIPRGAPHDMRAVVHFRDRDELWYETLLDPLIRPGEWTRMVVDITADNLHGLKPVNHVRPWDDYSRTRLREIGIRIFCGHKYDGEIFIDNIYFAGAQTGRVAPKVTPVVVVRASAPATIARFDKWELDFDLNKSYPNPYDPEVVDVSARITRPDGKEVVVPAFFYEPYDRRLVERDVIPDKDDEDVPHKAEVEEIVPIAGGMKGFWKLRYAPELDGPHSVVLEVREGGKWRMTGERWIDDERYTHDGEPLPIVKHQDFDWGGGGNNQFTQIDGSRDDGRRKLQELDYKAGEVVARSAPISFSAAGSKNHGYVRRAKDPHYLEHSDGTFFYPVGMNLSTPSEEQLPFNGPQWRTPKAYRKLRDTGRRGTYQYDDYFAQFEKHKLNWAKFWMATWWTAMEWRRDWPPYQGAGRYSQPNAWRMDYLVEAARAKNIFVQIILMNHGQVSSGINRDWQNNPYSVELGGPVKAARDFYSDYNAKRLFKNKLRYIAARWGYSTSIMDWTICGEMDFTEDYQTNGFDLMVPANDRPAPESMISWIEEMGGYMKEIDPGHHLIGTHVSHPQRGQNIQMTKILDYVQSNAYSGFPWLANSSMNAVKALFAYYYGQGGQNHFRGMHAFGKPVLICEQGGHWHGISKKYGNWTRNTRESLDADLHCGLWAGLMTPLAGQTGYWWWLHVHFDGGYEHFEAIQNFMEGEDLRGANFERNAPRVEGNGKNIEALAFQNSKHGFAWFYDKMLPYRLASEEYSGIKAWINDVDPGAYEIEFWNTHEGKVISKVSVDAVENQTKDGYYLPITLPKFEGDIAVKFRKK